MHSRLEHERRFLADCDFERLLGSDRAVIRIRVRRVIIGGISGALGRLARSVARQPLTESIDRLEQQTEYWLRQSLRGGPVPRAPAPVRRGPVRGDPVVAVPTFHRS